MAQKSKVDISDILEDLDKVQDITPLIVDESLKQETDAGDMWDSFISLLSESTDSSGSGKKLYKIDDDIIDTLNECDFNGCSNRHLINSMLRTFILKYKDEFLSRRVETASLLSH